MTLDMGFSINIAELYCPCVRGTIDGERSSVKPLHGIFWIVGVLDQRSLNIDTFDPIYVLMDHALPEEAQSRPVQRAGDAQAGVHPQVSNRGEAAHPSGSVSFGFAIRPE